MKLVLVSFTLIYSAKVAVNPKTTNFYNGIARAENFSIVYSSYHLKEQALLSLLM